MALGHVGTTACVAPLPRRIDQEVADDYLALHGQGQFATHPR